MMFQLAHFWQAVRILAACALSYVVARLIGLQEDYWALVTAIVVTQPALSDALSAGRDRVLGTLVGALAGLGVIGASELGVPAFPLFWIALIPLSILTAVKPNLRLSCVTLVIVVLVPSMGRPFARPIERIVEILIGTIVAIAVSAAIPTQRKNVRSVADGDSAPGPSGAEG
jgi:uncharacterized membrane protein YccC